MTTAPETLPAFWYHDAEIYARERQEIFRRHWSLIAREEQLAAAGDYVAGEIAGWPLFVIRGRDGALKGFHNVCRHQVLVVEPRAFEIEETKPRPAR